MDPLTALGVVTNVVTLVDFGCKLVVAGKKALSAARDDSQELREVQNLTACLRDAADRLSFQSTQPLTYCALSPFEQNNEAKLQEISRDCAKLANELLGCVAASVATDPKSARQKARAVMNSLKNHFTRNSEDLAKRLESHKRQLETHVLLSIRDGVIQQVLSTRSIHERFNQQERQMISKLEQGKHSFAEILTSIQSLRTDLTYFIVADGDKTRELLNESLGSQREKPEKSFVRGLLRSLWYSGAFWRRDEIEEPCSETCERALANNECDESSTLGDWLCGEDPLRLYWIAGKPGAGKSTMMKFLATNPMSFDLLNCWETEEQKSEPIVITHFFSYMGEELQKTIVGMLRSLLYQLLSQVLEMSDSIMEHMKPHLTSWNGHVDWDMVDWNIANLLSVFDKLWKAVQSRGKCCMFIDGLDECSDDHEELVKTMKSLIKKGAGDIRIMAASRPWPIFKEEFELSGQARVFFMHDFTYSSILRYATDQLYKSEHFKMFSVQHPVMAERIAVAFVERANGVFVWVKLAVRQIRQRMRRGRITPPALLKEVERIPGELANFYDLILDRLDEEERRECALLLQLYVKVDGFFNKSDHTIVLYLIFRVTHLLFETDNVAKEIKSKLSLLNHEDSSDHEDEHDHEEGSDRERDSDEENDSNQEHDFNEENDSDQENDYRWLIERSAAGLLEYHTHEEVGIGIAFPLHATVFDWLGQTKTQERLGKWFPASEKDIYTAMFASGIFLLQTCSGSDEARSLIRLLGEIHLRLFSLKPFDNCYPDKMSQDIERIFGSYDWQSHPMIEVAYRDGVMLNDIIWLRLCWLQMNASHRDRYISKDCGLCACHCNLTMTHDKITFYRLWPMLADQCGKSINMLTWLVLRSAFGEATDIDARYLTREHCSVAFMLLIIFVTAEYVIEEIFVTLECRWSLLQEYMEMYQPDPNQLVSGFSCSAWYYWISYLDKFAHKFIRKQNLLKRAGIITSKFLRCGATRLEDIVPAVCQPCPSAEVPKGSDCLHPEILTELQKLGTYHGPIHSHFEWAKAKLQRERQPFEVPLSDRLVEEFVNGATVSMDESI